MQFDIFEAIMLVAFGLSWPFSIYKSWTTKRIGSKSLAFLVCIGIGYIAGVVHKIIVGADLVLLLYVLNLVMVLVEVTLFFRNRESIRESLKEGCPDPEPLPETD